MVRAFLRTAAGAAGGLLLGGRGAAQMSWDDWKREADEAIRRMQAAQKRLQLQFPPMRYSEAQERLKDAEGLERTRLEGWSEFFLTHYDEAIKLFERVIADVDAALAQQGLEYESQGMMEDFAAF